MATAPAPFDPDAHLLARAAADPAFRQALLTDAKAAVERELGVTIPAGKKIVVLQESADVHYLVLPPPAANRELSDRELDAVSGGSHAMMTLLKSIVDGKGESQRDTVRFR
jgi:hypothetical protein